mgnify:CR=1 FL=1|jgi:hypothetical protein
MGGLLDKANAVKDAEIVEESPAPVKADTKAEALPKPVESKTDSSSSPAGNPDTAMKLNLGGWVVILLGAILSLQGGAWGFLAVSVVLVLGIGAIVQADRMRGGLNKPKLYASIGVALLIASGPYAVVMLFPTNANIAVTDVIVDEDNDELDFAIRGSFKSVELNIQSNGEILWEGSGDMANDLKRFNVPFDDFFDGNTEDYDGSIIKTYTIHATSSNGNEVDLDINPRHLTRQALDGGVQFTPYVSTDEGSSGTDASSEIEGIRVQAFVGLFADGEKEMDDGKHSYAATTSDGGSKFREFTGQQVYTLTVSKSGSSGYTHPQVTLDGDLAKWTSEYSGATTRDAFGFVYLSGTALDDDGFEYIESEDFYDGDGCYDFTLTVTNQNIGGDHSTTFTVVNSWEFNWDGGTEETRHSYPTC